MLLLLLLLLIRVITAHGSSAAPPQAVVPPWQLHTEAALFWRAAGNGTRALQCVRLALSEAPPPHRHLPIISAANLLLHHGLHTHANTLLEQALAANASEVTHTQPLLNQPVAPWWPHCALHKWQNTRQPLKIVILIIFNHL